MLSALLNQNSIHPATPKEGELYRALTIAGKTFHLYYGYYEDFERAYNDPMPIYPDFLKNPLCTLDGIPFVTAMQDVCEYYSGESEDDGCSACVHFHGASKK